MPDIAIVGGLYVEHCIQPLWSAVYGSAGRAAQCITSLIDGKISLYGYVATEIQKEVESLALDCEAILIPASSSQAICFDYLHPLSTPIISPAISRIAANNAIEVNADIVLRYGMLEGDAVTRSRLAVYDPQSAFNVRRFSDNGSRAEALAIVMNRYEARAMTGIGDPSEAAKSLIRSGEAVVVIVKMGSQGALVVTPDRTEFVPIYETERVWKIGSGDVFSATFAALWACQAMSAVEAADLASRATAYYCQNRSSPSPSVDELRKMDNRPCHLTNGTVYLASPFFDLGQRWLVEEARSILQSLGAQVFSPVHAVGPGPASIVAPEDIKGLESSDVVFAVLNGLDTGTIFEIGYAVKKGIPVVALAQNVKPEDLKMIEGTKCEVVDDFVSAAYRTIWRLPKI